MKLRIVLLATLLINLTSSAVNAQLNSQGGAYIVGRGYNMPFDRNMTEALNIPILGEKFDHGIAMKMGQCIACRQYNDTLYLLPDILWQINSSLRPFFDTFPREKVIKFLKGSLLLACMVKGNNPNSSLNGLDYMQYFWSLYNYEPDNPTWQCGLALYVANCGGDQRLKGVEYFKQIVANAHFKNPRLKKFAYLSSMELWKQMYNEMWNYYNYKVEDYNKCPIIPAHTEHHLGYKCMWVIRYPDMPKPVPQAPGDFPPPFSAPPK